MTNPTQQIDEYVASLSGWQHDNLVQFRDLVRSTLPNSQEVWKWGVPVYLVNGKLVCAMSTFKDHTKYNFFQGAALRDSHGLFNSGLDSKDHRSINLAQGAAVDQAALQDLLRQAAALVA